MDPLQLVSHVVQNSTFKIQGNKTNREVTAFIMVIVPVRSLISSLAFLYQLTDQLRRVHLQHKFNIVKSWVLKVKIANITEKPSGP